MPLFREPKFDAKAESDHACARVNARAGRHNVHLSNFAVPIVGAILAILFTIYALSRPSIMERLHAPPAPKILEIDLE